MDLRGSVEDAEGTDIFVGKELGVTCDMGRLVNLDLI